MRRPAPPRDIPPPLELECLKALWNLGEGRVRDVRQALVEDRHLAYTTVMTILDRLEKRGKVARRKDGRSYIYVPKVSRDALRKLAIKDLVDDFFDGSEASLREYLQSISPEPEPQDRAPEASTGMEAALL
jgi:predicted transcriptional regulator